MRSTFVLARYAVLEAMRSGLPWLLLAMLVAAMALAAFLSRVAITESSAVQASLAASLLRLCAVFLVAAHVVSATVRDYNDRGIELILALPLSRASYYLGRLCGFAAIAILVGGGAALPLFMAAPIPDVLIWALSLCIEAMLVASVALFFAMSLAQMVPALAATLALYLLARVMPSVQAIAASPLTESGALLDFGRMALDGVALLLPPLDLATRAEWLLYGSPPVALLAKTFSALLTYAGLGCAAGLFDFSRRNL